MGEAESKLAKERKIKDGRSKRIKQLAVSR